MSKFNLSNATMRGGVQIGDGGRMVIAGSSLRARRVTTIAAVLAGLSAVAIFGGNVVINLISSALEPTLKAVFASAYRPALLIAFLVLAALILIGAVRSQRKP